MQGERSCKKQECLNEIIVPGRRAIEERHRRGIDAKKAERCEYRGTVVRAVKCKQKRQRHTSVSYVSETLNKRVCT